MGFPRQHENQPVSDLKSTPASGGLKHEADENFYEKGATLLHCIINQRQLSNFLSI